MHIRRLQFAATSLLLAATCLGQAAPASSVIDVEARFQLFDRQDIEAITREKSMIAVADLTALCKKGKSPSLFPPLKGTSLSGQETTVKAMVERIYPTSISVIYDTVATNPPSPASGSLVEPSGFQMREVGVILSYEAKLSDDDTNVIEMTMSPQAVVELAPTKFKGVHINDKGQQTEIPLEQPVFKTLSTSESLSVRDGETVVIGGQYYGQDDKVLFVLVTAQIRRLLNTTPQASGKPGAVQPER